MPDSFENPTSFENNDTTQEKTDTWTDKQKELFKMKTTVDTMNNNSNETTFDKNASSLNKRTEKLVNNLNELKKKPSNKEIVQKAMEEASNAIESALQDLSHPNLNMTKQIDDMFKWVNDPEKKQKVEQLKWFVSKQEKKRPLSKEINSWVGIWPSQLEEDTWADVLLKDDSSDVSGTSETVLWKDDTPKIPKDILWWILDWKDDSPKISKDILWEDN